MHLHLAGINYQTSPLSTREKTAIGVDRLANSLMQLRRYVQHGVILSTCNRTEIYVATGESHNIEQTYTDFIKAHFVTEEILPSQIYCRGGRDVIEHLFRVACGLDSMVIGEHEVLGQVRQAVDIAEKMSMVNLPLRHAFRSAIRAGRRVREETGIGKHAMSVSSIAVNKALEIVPDVNKSKLMIIGTGEAGNLVVKGLRDRGSPEIVMVSRTEDRAMNISGGFGGRAVSHNKIVEELIGTDIVIACAASPHPLLHHNQVLRAMSIRPVLQLIIIDIAAPRNFAPEAGKISNVHLLNIDDLNNTADNNRACRENEIASAEAVMQQEINILMKWWKAYQASPAIKALVVRAEKIRASQYHKLLKNLQHISEEDKQSINRLTVSIVDKILRDPILFLKSDVNADNGSGSKSELIREIFRLGDCEL